MDQPAVCPNCKRPIPPGMPEGLCPNCLLGAAVAELHRDAPQPAELGDLIPGYQFESLIGHGGAGAVYRARHVALKRIVAIKLIPAQTIEAGLLEDGDRFLRESRALAMLKHPHIVTVYDFGHAGDFYYLVMEFVGGSNLRRMIDAGSIPPRAALPVVIQMCDALQYAHEHGVVHRDIKPENILIDESGGVKIADFGLVKIVQTDADAQPLTLSSQRVGTPIYMAPEQLEDPRSVDHRADIYALGVVFYELLTRELPIGRFDPPSRFQRMDLRLDDIVLKALAKQRERRYQRAGDVSTDVEFISRTGGSRTRAPKSDSRGSRARRVAMLVTLALLLVPLWTGVGGGQHPLLKPLGRSGLFYPRADAANVSYASAVALAAVACAAFLIFTRRGRVILLIPLGALITIVCAALLPVHGGPLLAHFVLPEFVGRFEFSPKGTLLIARVADVEEIDPASAHVIRTYTVRPGQFRFLAVSPDDTRLAVSAGLDDQFDLIDRQSGRTIAQHDQLQGTVPHLAFSSDSAQLVVTLNDRFNAERYAWVHDEECGLYFFDARDGHFIRHDKIDRVAMSHDDVLHWVNDRIAFTDALDVAHDNWTFRVWDPVASHNVVRKRIPEMYRYSSMRLSPDAQLLAVGWLTEVVLVHVETQEVVDFLSDGHTPTGGARIRSMCFSPDGHLLATAWPDGTIVIHELTGRSIRATYPVPGAGGTNPILIVRFDPTGKSLAAGTANGELWTFETP